MTNCNQIKRLIDETEQPEVMPFAATHHLNACASCRMFADDRASLRALLNGIPRVNAPINFDAQLKARINTAKAKPAFSWFSPALYLRFGAASAVLLIAVFVAQYNGLFSPATNIASTGNTPASAPGQIASIPAPITKERQENVTPVPTPAVTFRPSGMVAVASTNRGSRRVQQGIAKAEDDSMSAKVPGFLAFDVVRRQDRDVEVDMLTVSVGAQPNMNRVDAKQKLVGRSGRPSGRSSERALVQQSVALQSF